MNKRVNLLNCPVDLCDINSALFEVNSAINDKRNFHIITLNPEMVINAQISEEFMATVNNSDLNVVDGVGIKYALKVRGINAKQVRGVDLSRALIQLAAQKKYKIAFLGASEEVITCTSKNFLKKYPDLQLVYVQNGYFDVDREIIQEIVEAAPQIILVGLGSPRQEEFIEQLKQKIQGCVMIGVGGSFDVFSGMVQEAPQIFRKLGLEWLYRTIIDPKRLKRIFPTLPIFIVECIIETIRLKGKKN